MDNTQNVGGRDRLIRFLLAAGLSIVAVRWLRRGKRVRGAVAGVGALGFGFNATTGYCGVNEALDVDTTGDGVSIEFDESGDATSGPSDDAAGEKKQRNHLACAACGDPIVPGQSRGPNEDDDIVHDACA